MNPVRQSKLEKWREALDWRLRGWLGDPAVDFPKISAARLWRTLLNRTIFIGITGSAGKTTAKELLLAVLASKGNVVGNPNTLNVLAEVAKLVLRTRRSHDYCVSEVGAPKPGSMDAPLKLFRPGIGIVTVIGDDHLSAYLSREAIAQEKGKLVDHIPAHGTAVLNADDELVFAMASRSAGKVISYGHSPRADVRATDISATWPDRLALTVSHGSKSIRVQSQLCGPHLAIPALSAIAGGIAAGLTLEECARGIANAPPFTGRMQPVMSTDGVTFIRDDFKAPLWTVDACFEFMRSAQAKRKIIVIGMLSDLGIGTGAPEKYAKVARRAQEIADLTIFVGPWASHVLKARKTGTDGGDLRVYSHVHAATQYLNSMTREGDLILLKGTNKQDHLQRIILARTNDVACWRNDCQRSFFCDECPDRMVASGVPRLPMRNTAAPVAAEAVSAGNRRAVDKEEQVIIGLGNPEPQFAETPHNVGYAAVDQIALALGLSWESYADAWIARGASKERAICLVKMRTAMNYTGDSLKQLAQSMAFEPEQCILLYDDLDMALGAVRTRLSGGAAGHRGVVSILEAFQTDAFRRVKIGVGQPDAKLNRVEYVLTAFDPTARATVDQAVNAASIRALELAANRRTPVSA